MSIQIPYLRVGPAPIANQDVLYAIERQAYIGDERGVAKGLLGLIARQGGSATSWATVGTTSYPLAAFGVQVGAVQWTGVSAVAGGVTVTYPTPFLSHPLVFAIAINDTSNYVQTATDSNNGVNNFNLYWHTTDAAEKTAVDFAWLAIGPL